MNYVTVQLQKKKGQDFVLFIKLHKMFLKQLTQCQVCIALRA